MNKQCSLCDGPIAPARLEALPGIGTCIECARKNPQKFDYRLVDLSEACPINKNGFSRNES